MLGYHKNGTPDLNWWNYQINLGIQYRQECTGEAHWARWRAYYRQKYPRGAAVHNIYFEIIQSLIPRLYPRVPTISATAQDNTMESYIIAKIVERTTNKLFKMMKLKETMQSILMTGFFTGSAIGKYGFGGIHVPTPAEYDNLLPVDRQGNPVSWAANVEANFPWFKKVETQDFIVPDKTNTTGDNAWFECHRITVNLEDMKRYSHFKNVKNLSSNLVEAETIIPEFTDSEIGPSKAIRQIYYYEVRDRRNNSVFVYTPNQGTKAFRKGGVLHYQEQDSLQNAFQSNFSKFTYNKDDEYWWGIPYAQLIEPMQLDLNKIKTYKMKHLYLSLVKFIYDESKVPDNTVKALLSGKPMAALKVKAGGMGGVKPFQVNTVPIEYFRMGNEILDEFKQIVGLSKNAQGQATVDKSHTNITAEEISRINGAVSLRLDQSQDELANMTVDVARLCHSTIFKHWDQEMVVNIAGESMLPYWVKFRGSLIANARFKLSVDVDSPVAASQTARKQDALQLYSLLMQDPNVNHQAITKRLLQEFWGIESDQFIIQPQAIPQQAQGIPQAAGNLQQLAASNPAMMSAMLGGNK